MDPERRGAQLSIRLRPGLLKGVMKALEEKGVVVDERQPDVIRVAPAPLYNTFVEVGEFVNIVQTACREAQAGSIEQPETATALKGQEAQGWNTIK